MVNNIQDRLASASGRNDEALNLALAAEIAGMGNGEAVVALIACLQNKKATLQSDAIKVLYEIGNLRPDLIAGHTPDFVALLDSKLNRLQWGAMSALNSIAAVQPRLIMSYIERLTLAAGSGSVITRDNFVAIAVKLYVTPEYAEQAFSLLVHQLLDCPLNQLPMYAEQIQPSIAPQHIVLFAETLYLRLKDIDKESKRKRLEKVLQRLQGKR